HKHQRAADAFGAVSQPNKKLRIGHRARTLTEDLHRDLRVRRRWRPALFTRERLKFADEVVGSAFAHRSDLSRRSPYQQTGTELAHDHQSRVLRGIDDGAVIRLELGHRVWKRQPSVQLGLRYLEKPQLVGCEDHFLRAAGVRGRKTSVQSHAVIVARPPAEL